MRWHTNTTGPLRQLDERGQKPSHLHLDGGLLNNFHDHAASHADALAQELYMHSAATSFPLLPFSGTTFAKDIAGTPSRPTKIANLYPKSTPQRKNCQTRISIVSVVSNIIPVVKIYSPP
jgi:hypothetical protein